MITRIGIAVASVALLAACGAPSNDSGDKSADSYTLNVENLAAHIKTLASDGFGGRAPASKGEDLTVAYLSEAFKAAGLKPANGDSYSQPVPLVSIETEGSPVLTFTKEDENQELAYRNDMVIWSRQEVGEISLDASDMVFVGYGINAPERNWNDYEGIDVTGKTVVIMINDPGYATQDPELFNGNAMTYYGRWTYKYDEAARQGAAGAIIIHDTKPAAYGWSTVEGSWTGPQFSAVREDKGKDFALAEGWITTEAANNLFAMAGLNRAELEDAAKVPDFKAVEMNVKASTQFTNKIDHVNTQNVAGILEGRTHPDEYFIYMGHWDHLGTDPTKEGDGIYNGAFDNASGTAGLVELARYFAGGKQPERSIMFLAVGAEEQGLLGSRHYASNPLVPLNQTVGGINIDGLNNVGPTSDITVVGRGNSEMDDYLMHAAAERGRTLTADPEPEKGFFYRSDHFELAKYGVPMLYPEMGYVHVEHGRDYMEKAREDYLVNRYHGPADEYDDSWDLTGAIADLDLFAAVGAAIVNSTDWPKWSPDSEFKAAREASMKEKEAK